MILGTEGDLDQEEREREEALQRRRAEEEVSTHLLSSMQNNHTYLSYDPH